MDKAGVIAFCGSKGSGKSTSCNIFKELYNGTTEEIAIAGHLKRACSEVFNVDMKHFLEPELKEREFDKYIVLDRKNVEGVYRQFDLVDMPYDSRVRPFIGQVLETPRRLLQHVGTELLHPVDPLIHIKKAVNLMDPTKLAVVTDLRFLGEFNFFKDTLNASFLPVYVKRSSAECQAENDSHSSERELLLFRDQCTLLPNELGLEELKVEVKKLIDINFKE